MCTNSLKKIFTKFFPVNSSFLLFLLSFPLIVSIIETKLLGSGHIAERMVPYHDPKKIVSKLLQYYPKGARYLVAKHFTDQSHQNFRLTPVMLHHLFHPDLINQNSDNLKKRGEDVLSLALVDAEALKKLSLRDDLYVASHFSENHDSTTIARLIIGKNWPISALVKNIMHEGTLILTTGDGSEPEDFLGYSIFHAAAFPTTNVKFEYNNSCLKKNIIALELILILLSPLFKFFMTSRSHAL